MLILEWCGFHLICCWGGGKKEGGWESSEIIVIVIEGRGEYKKAGRTRPRSTHDENAKSAHLPEILQFHSIEHFIHSKWRRYGRVRIWRMIVP